MAAAGAAAVAIEVNARGWWGFATSWIDLSVLAVWLGLAGWLSGWAFKNAEGWWHVPSFLGAFVSVIGVALLLLLAVMWLVSEHPDTLIDDSKCSDSEIVSALGSLITQHRGGSMAL